MCFNKFKPGFMAHREMTNAKACLDLSLQIVAVKQFSQNLRDTQLCTLWVGIWVWWQAVKHKRDSSSNLLSTTSRKMSWSPMQDKAFKVARPDSSTKVLRFIGLRLNFLKAETHCVQILRSSATSINRISAPIKHPSINSIFFSFDENLLNAKQQYILVSISLASINLPINDAFFVEHISMSWNAGFIERAPSAKTAYRQDRTSPCMPFSMISGKGDKIALPCIKRWSFLNSSQCLV